MHAGPAAQDDAAPPVPGRHGSQSDQPDRFSVASAMPATFHQRRGSLTMFFTAILRSVRRRGPTPSSLRRRPAYFAGSSPLLPM